MISYKTLHRDQHVTFEPRAFSTGQTSHLGHIRRPWDLAGGTVAEERTEEAVEDQADAADAAMNDDSDNAGIDLFATLGVMRSQFGKPHQQTAQSYFLSPAGFSCCARLIGAQRRTLR